MNDLKENSSIDNESIEYDSETDIQSESRAEKISSAWVHTLCLEINRVLLNVTEADIQDIRVHSQLLDLVQKFPSSLGIGNHYEFVLKTFIDKGNIAMIPFFVKLGNKCASTYGRTGGLKSHQKWDDVELTLPVLIVRCEKNSEMEKMECFKKLSKLFTGKDIIEYSLLSAALASKHMKLFEQLLLEAGYDSLWGNASRADFHHFIEEDLFNDEESLISYLCQRDLDCFKIVLLSSAKLFPNECVFLHEDGIKLCKVLDKRYQKKRHKLITILKEYVEQSQFNNEMLNTLDNSLNDIGVWFILNLKSQIQCQYRTLQS